MPDVLLIAFHFPPVAGSSGVQRTLRFSQYLPKFGWRPIVLTIDPRAYEATADLAGNESANALEVYRAFGLDAARQLAIRGRYWRRSAIPDRWMSWKYWAIRRAMKVIRSGDVRVIWSTFPIPTAHVIGLEIARRTGLPWVAEFRDPMWQGTDYPRDAVVNAAWRTLEQQVFESASHVVVTTPGARQIYLNRFGEQAGDRLSVIENGFDEEAFLQATAKAGNEADGGICSEGRPAVLLHSGIIYPEERDPSKLFAAIAHLKRTGQLDKQNFKLSLRASGHDEQFRPQLRKLGIDDIVELAAPLPYLAALREMTCVEGLLLLQAANCNEQIPAKLYEYIRARRPIVALTDPAGDTAICLQAAGGGLLARLDDEKAICGVLLQFVNGARNRTLVTPDQSFADSCSRESRTREFALLLDKVAAQ